MEEYINNFWDFISKFDGYMDSKLLLLLLMLICLPSIFFFNNLTSSAIRKFLEKYGSRYSEILEKHRFYSSLNKCIIAAYLLFWENIFDVLELLPIIVIHVVDKILFLYLTYVITMILFRTINALEDIYKRRVVSKHVPVALYAQILRVILIICSAVVLISFITGVSVHKFFASLGAAAAVLTLIFKDSVLGLMSSLQITTQDIVRVGDWINLPQYGVEGNVESITISVVKIRNFDKTISTVPTVNLLTTHIKNWRGMIEAEGRRIKRAINIDVNSVGFCDDELVKSLKKLPEASNAFKKKVEKEEKKVGLTNMGLFRIYVYEYMKQNKSIHNNNFTFLVRELAPTPDGFPLEIYVFSKETNWVKYEDIQSELIEHFIAIMPEFQLKSYQRY